MLFLSKFYKYNFKSKFKIPSGTIKMHPCEINRENKNVFSESYV